MSHENLKKEIYEERRKKMATDGQVDTNDNVPKGKRLPPFMKPNNDKVDPRKNARKTAIQARLASMGKKGK